MSKIRHILFLGIILTNLVAISQKTKVTGIVKDSVTNEPLPFVNVFFNSTKVGVTTNIEGEFVIETFYATDSLVISFIGYKKLKVPVNKDHSQHLEILLNESFTALEEITIISSDINPAHAIINNVIKNKKINNREMLSLSTPETLDPLIISLCVLGDFLK